MNGVLTMEERITKQQLQKLYGVNRKTIEDWVQNYNLPMIQISPYKRFVRKIYWNRKKLIWLGNPCPISTTVSFYQH